MTEFRKIFRQVVMASMNADQIAHTAYKVNHEFDLRNETGFEKSIAIPASAAVDAVLRFFRREEELIQFLEWMMDREGVLWHGATVRIAGKREIIEFLAKRRWIFDPDVKLFFRDRFYTEQANFFHRLEYLDLRGPEKLEKVDSMIREIKGYTENAKSDDPGWQSTVRLYQITGKSMELVKALIELMLARDGLTEITPEIVTCYKEIAINASKASYKGIYEKVFEEETGMSPNDNYHYFLERFRQEIENNGDSKFIKMAQKKDVFFDLLFKVGDHNLSFWATNYTPIHAVEKKQMLQKFQLSRDNHDMMESLDEENEFAEGAGLGIRIVLNILKKYGNSPQPLYPVFYRDQVKVGFYLSRDHLRAVAGGAGG